LINYFEENQVWEVATILSSSSSVSSVVQIAAIVG